MVMRMDDVSTSQAIQSVAGKHEKIKENMMSPISSFLTSSIQTQKQWASVIFNLLEFGILFTIAPPKINTNEDEVTIVPHWKGDSYKMLKIMWRTRISR